MSFYTKIREDKERKTFNRPTFMSFNNGTFTVRILQPEAKGFLTHWMGGPVECLGDDCPQCKQNKQMIAESGYNEARLAKGYVAQSERAVINILDRTPVKLCPECKAEVNAVDDIFPNACPNCSTMIMKVPALPSNKVKLFSRAASVFEKIAGYDKTILDENGEPVGITNFDIELLVSGNTTIPRPLRNSNDKVEVPDEMLFDLEAGAIKLNADEMLERMKGVSFKDIFAARRIDAESKSPEPSEVAEEVKARAKTLFET